MSVNPLNILQTKVNDLEDLLGCYVCGEQLSGKITLCTEGHPVCQKCSIRIFKCPLCNSKFNGTRDYLGESLISKFEELKIVIDSLIINQDVLCTESTTIKPMPTLAEKFPCAINHCREMLSSHNDMIGHIHFIHEDILIDKGVIKSDILSEWFRVPYYRGTDWEKIIYVHNMGIFILKININRGGEVNGCLRITTVLNNTESYFYKLEIDHPYYDGIYFDGPVQSIQTPQDQERQYYLNIGKAIQRGSHCNFFQCCLIITRIQ